MWDKIRTTFSSWAHGSDIQKNQTHQAKPADNNNERLICFGSSDFDLIPDPTIDSSLQHMQASTSDHKLLDIESLLPLKTQSESMGSEDIASEEIASEYTAPEDSASDRTAPTQAPSKMTWGKAARVTAKHAMYSISGFLPFAAANSAVAINNIVQFSSEFISKHGQEGYSAINALMGATGNTLKVGAYITLAGLAVAYPLGRYVVTPAAQKSYDVLMPDELKTVANFTLAETGKFLEKTQENLTTLSKNAYEAFKNAPETAPAALTRTGIALGGLTQQGAEAVTRATREGMKDDARYDRAKTLMAPQTASLPATSQPVTQTATQTVSLPETQTVKTQENSSSIKTLNTPDALEFIPAEILPHYGENDAPHNTSRLDQSAFLEIV